MAKPILVLDVSHSISKYAKEIIETIKMQTENEYHVIIRGIDNNENTIQCFNDCKGLPDIDIEMLINEIKTK